jgi:magnesium transporter
MENIKKNSRGVTTPGWLLEVWRTLASEERWRYFDALSRTEQEDVFLGLSARGQTEIYLRAPAEARRTWIRLLPPDEAADVIQRLPTAMQRKALSRLDVRTASEVAALLAYAEDRAGGVMNPRFARLRPEMTVDEAISYLRAQSSEQIEALYYAYVLDPEQRLVGVVSFRELLTAVAGATIAATMKTNLVTVTEEMRPDEISQKLSQRGLRAVPVVDSGQHIRGIVTADDLVGLVQETATKEIQRIGGMEALDAPYFQIPFGQMLRKRGGWLTILFLSEMLTATAMGYFQHEIERAVVLALFIPLIISSGGNSGSQASTLIVRAMALGEVRLRDWWRIMGKEVVTGLILGAVLGSIGLLRILVWPSRGLLYGEHYFLVGLTVAFSLVGVVLWGALSGSMLPLLLRKLGFDPASASAPFVATLVDVTGLVIYFSVASVVLQGTLL